MNTSRSSLITAALVAIICVPVGYYVRIGKQPLAKTDRASRAEVESPTTGLNVAPGFGNSALFTEWRQLHDTYGTNADAMPDLYEAFSHLKDPFRRRAFRAALFAEWAQVDPAGGLAFCSVKGRDPNQRRQFFDEWLALDARAAVDALMVSGPGWEAMARDSLAEIVRRVPERVADLVSRLPKSDNFWIRKCAMRS